MATRTSSVMAAFLIVGSVSFAASSVHEFTLDAINGTPTPLAKFKGQAMLLVNVASQCGYTYQYEGLQALYVKYKDQGLVVVGFPANNFGSKEPGSPPLYGLRTVRVPVTKRWTCGRR